MAQPTRAKRIENTDTERLRAISSPRNQKEFGSVPWCLQTVSMLKIQWSQAAADDRGFIKIVDEIRQAKAFKKVPPSEPYGSMSALLVGELGISQTEARSITRRLVRLGKRGRPADKGDNYNLYPDQRGTSEEYLMARLRRDAPEYLARYEAGEFRSLWAAAEAAGIRRPALRRFTSVPAEDMADCARYLKERLSPEQIAALIEALQ